jgi:cytochrome P450
LFAAGAVETTQNTMTMGLMTLLEHPGELARLRQNPELAIPATEEILRWCPPVTSFVRTATRDTEIRGQAIAEGDSVCMFYPSANRDEAVFPDADRFRIDRNRNPHLTFGFGRHICMGAHLARLEIQCLLRELVPRLEHAEPSGPPEFMRTSSILGPKRLPLRVRVRPGR